MSGERSREDAESLVASYATGSLEPAEAAAAEELLRTTPALRAVFEETLEAVALLAAATADVEPPARLRARIVEAARAEGRPEGAGPSAASPTD